METFWRYFLKPPPNKLRKKRLSLSPWGRPLDADEVMKRFSSLEKRIYLYFERKHFKSLPSNEQRAPAGSFASLIHLYPLIQPASACTRVSVRKVLKSWSPESISWTPTAIQSWALLTQWQTLYYQVDTEDFSNKKWPVSKSGPEPRALWRMCMYIVKLHIIPKDDQKKKKTQNVFIG